MPIGPAVWRGRDKYGMLARVANGATRCRRAGARTVRANAEGRRMGSHFTIDDYTAALAMRTREPVAARAREPVPEVVIQQFWYDRAAESGTLATVEGHKLEVVSPGWWNHCAGPDFQGAQLRFNGKLCHGDVEVHLDQPSWYAHGHHRDPRYDGVLLHVVLEPAREDYRVETASGRAIPHLNLDSLPALAEGGLRTLPDVEEQPALAPREHGSCNRFLALGDESPLHGFIRLSGDWRLLNKARDMEARIRAAGADQAAYEMLCRALGYRAFTEPFMRLARALPFERARHLAVQAPHLLEAALLHLAGLLPAGEAALDALPPHGQRLAALRGDHLPSLQALPVGWPVAGVRPNNYPARRIAGLAGFVGRVARVGLARSLELIWMEHTDPVRLRGAFEALFPRPLGFWSQHYRFDGPALARPCAPIGGGRVRSIIGNVFVPLAMAEARMRGDQAWEERVRAFYHRLPMEPDNYVYKRMLPRVLGDQPPRMNFHLQQGLMQMHEDWCASNPSCRHCPLLGFLEGRR
ncbi:MAG: DUF2851 family protein [Candidatus Hydrogenedentes bacterium]|nr:DUF2851 family protein [Candidatus Hydrogenedentota bacterium]